MSSPTQVPSAGTQLGGRGDGAAEQKRPAPAGWYYDPADEAIYRYWDGERWTDRLSDTVTSELIIDARE